MSTSKPSSLTDSPAPADGVVDPKAVSTLRMLGLVGRLFPAYLQVLPEQVQALRSALADGNQGEARRLAHRLRGSSAQLGAAGLARLLSDVESAAEAGEASLARFGAALDETVAATVVALKQELDTSG